MVRRFGAPVLETPTSCLFAITEIRDIVCFNINISHAAFLRNLVNL
jgi:hypothetical protein